MIKNKPALGEQALHELVADNLLKYNYFLCCDRGRKLKSYMKAPIPAAGDPAREQLIHTLSKHGIDFFDYSAAYKKSSIPPNNILSKLTVEIFECNSHFVTEYSKYQNQLNDVIRKHLGNGSIRETEGCYVIQNQGAFLGKFQDVENVHTKRQSVISSRQPTATTRTTTAPQSTIQIRITTAENIDIPGNTIKGNSEVQDGNGYLPRTSVDEYRIDICGES